MDSIQGSSPTTTMKLMIYIMLSNTNRVVTTILGYSRGGNVVLLYASKYRDNNIRNVVKISGRYDLKKGILLGENFLDRIKQHGFINAKEGESVFRVTEESLMDRLNKGMHQAYHKIDKECKALTVHGSDDKVVPVEDYEKDFN